MEPVYIVVHAVNQEIYTKYDGLGVQVISDMLTAQGLTGTTISKEDYDSYTLVHQPVHP